MRLASKLKFISLLTVLTLSLVATTPLQTQAYTTCDGIESGDTVVVEYTGTKQSNGEVFDTTEDRGPATFTIAPEQLIEGFYKGMLGLFIGDRETITVPPSEGYTNPSHELYGETLIFEVYIVSLQGTIETCTSDERSGFSSTLFTALGWIFGIGAGGFIFFSLYLAVQRTTTASCVHCKAHNRTKQAEGTCSRCGMAYCRASFAKGCPNCGNNTFVPYDRNL